MNGNAVGVVILVVEFQRLFAFFIVQINGVHRNGVITEEVLWIDDDHPGMGNDANLIF